MMIQRVSPEIEAAAEREYEQTLGLEAWRIQDRVRAYRRELVRGPSATCRDALLGSILGANRALDERVRIATK